jgi:hypothetical protein
MKFGPLNDDNFIMYAMQAYDNPMCKGINEFNDDLTRVKYIKRLLNRYDKKKDLKERLILNHIILLNNVFGNEACSRILFFKVCPKLHPYLKSFLDYLQIIPKSIPEVDLNKIVSDHRVTTILNNLK